MKLLAVNVYDVDTNKHIKMAINPSQITFIVPIIDGVRIGLCGDTQVIISESFEEIMAMLGGDCEWRMP